MRGINSRAAVLDNAAHSFRLRQHGSNTNAPAQGLGLRHRLDRVDGKVHDHLLELGAVADDPGKVRRQFEGNGDAPRL